MVIKPWEEYLNDIVVSTNFWFVFQTKGNNDYRVYKGRQMK